MATRKRIQVAIRNVTGGGGGGPAPGGTISWGPSFGQSDGDDASTWNANAAVAMPTLGLTSNSLNATGAVAMPSLALRSDSLNATAQLQGSVLGAPFFQGIGQTTQTSNSTSVTLTPDQTATTGDFLVVNIGSVSLSSETFTAPSGWTLIRSSRGGNVNLHSYYKAAGASEPSSYTWTGGQSAAHVATIIRLTAVNATPINVENTATGTTADPVSPSITTTTDNCFMLSVCAQSNSLAQTYTPPAGYVERADQAGSNLGVVQVTSETATKVQAVAGASGTATHNSNQIAGSRWVCHHIAIAPGSLTIA